MDITLYINMSSDSIQQETTEMHNITFTVTKVFVYFLIYVTHSLAP